MPNIICDILVVGGSLGGVSAALSAAASGKTVFLLSESAWVGGQLTSQGVNTPDENAYIETVGSTNSYRAFRQLTRQYYTSNYQLSPSGTASVNELGHLMLGESWVSHGYSVEPMVADNILKQLLNQEGAHFVENVTVTSVVLSEDQTAITTTLAAGSDGTNYTFTAGFVLDATDLGILLPMAGAEHVVGAESQSMTNEPDAPTDGAHKDWIQPITYPIALERCPAGEEFTVPEPADYATVLQAEHFTLVDGDINSMFAQQPLPSGKPGEIFWTYRRVVEASLFQPNATPSSGDISNINTGSNDYLAAVIPSGDPVADAAACSAARHVSVCYTYWLQTACPHDPGDGEGIGYPNLRPVTEFWGTSDGISVDPYIREGRRIVAKTTILEQDIAVADMNGNPLQTGVRAKLFPDSCGIGHYQCDIHANALGMPEIELDTVPYQIPLGSLVPIRMVNLLPACKNIGVTHITNGAYRLHPIEWNVGESAGVLAAFCLDQQQTPQAVVSSPSLVIQYQKLLLAQGVPIFWWSDVLYSDPYFAAAQILGVQGIFTGTTQLEFGPDDVLTAVEISDLTQRIAPKVPSWPAGEITRSQAAMLLAAL
jgi:hypothetical protein